MLYIIYGVCLHPKYFFLYITVPLKVIVFPLDSTINSSLVMYQNDTELFKFSQITECLSKLTCIINLLYIYHCFSITV